MNTQTRQRISRINEVMHTLISCKDRGETLDHTRYAMRLSIKHGCSMRKAMEYIQIAIERIEMEGQDE